MHQETLSTHFKNVKRKSALEAKEKISNLNSNKLSIKEDDIQKPQKIIIDNVNSMNNNNANIDNSLKRKSTRNLKTDNFQIPESLMTNKKINLEEKINKKRKREEEEIIPEIQIAKKKLLNTKNKKSNKKNGKEEINETILNEIRMEIDDSSENNNSKLNTKKEKLKNINLNNCNIDYNKKTDENKNLISKKKDISDKTKEIMKKVLETKNKDQMIINNNHNNSSVNSLIINESNNIIKYSKDNISLTNKNTTKSNKCKNISSDKNYISDDVLDQFEENLKNKNKNKKNLLNNIIDKNSIAFKDGNTKVTRNNKKNNIDDSFITLNTSEIKNSSNNNIKDNSSPLNLNKLNNNFSFENVNSTIKNTTMKTNNNLILSSEVNAKNVSKPDFKIPTLSSETLKVINELKQSKKEQRENNFKRTQSKLLERDRSQSSFSLKFKYEELVKEERELLLPPSYKKLLLSFEKLDSTLNFFKMSKSMKISSFSEIKSSIENTHKENFEFEYFLKILYVVPHFFVYSWEKINKSEKKEYELIVGIPNNFEDKINARYDKDFDFIKEQTKYNPSDKPLSKEILEKRKMIFKNILLEIVNFHHKEFIKANKIKSFDPFKFKVWHSAFNLEKDVPEIPIFEIAEKPSIHIVKISDFLNENSFKSELIQKAIEKCTLENKIDTNSDSNFENISSAEEKEKSNKKSALENLINPKLLQKIKAKESAIKMHTEIVEYSTQKSKQKSRNIDLKDIIDRIKNIFIFEKYATIPLIELCEKIKSGSNTISSADSIDAIKKILYSLKEHFPSFIRIIESNHLGTVVKLDPNQEIKKILMEIEDKDLAEKIYDF